MKTKLSKKLEQEQNQRNGHHREEENVGEGTGNKEHNW